LQNVTFCLRLIARGNWRDVPPWLASMSDPDYLLNERYPWLTFRAVRRIERYLRERPGARVFEYGSGGSTLFWRRWGCSCVSVEHDEAWMNRVKRWIGDDPRCELRLVTPDPVPDRGTDADPSDPLGYRSGDPAFRGYSFERYARQIEQFPDASFDVVLVDGRARPSCLMHAIPKLRPGGIAILDNADRPYYLSRMSGHLGSFGRETFIGAAAAVATINRTDILTRERS
jgi:hypothetical protein